MKKIVLLLGPNAVGKSTTAQAMLERMERCAYVDSDWCRAMNPFPFTEATRHAAQEILYHFLRAYMICEDIDTILLTHSFHGGRKQGFEAVIDQLHADGLCFEIKPIVLRCEQKENIDRARRDGRDRERIERGMRNTFRFYDDYDCPQLDTTELLPAQAAEMIIHMLMDSVDKQQSRENPA